jgi:glycosyltransferase involved in cell wall biosynthesis
MARSLARVISKRQCNAVDAIAAPSQPMLNVLRAYGIDSEAQVIPTGLQQMSFAPADGAAFRLKHGIPLERPMLLYVGRVSFEKNISFLLDMTQQLVQQHPDVLLVVAGEGPAEASLHAQAKKLNLDNNIQFIGYLDRATELNACYQAADIFVFASKSETQGLVLLEAMAQGTPVVAIAELGTASILIEGMGALIAPDNVVGFAQRVHQLLLHPEERYALGKLALSYVTERWTAKTQAERILHFYHHLISVYQAKQKFDDAVKTTNQQVNVEF